MWSTQLHRTTMADLRGRTAVAASLVPGTTARARRKLLALAADSARSLRQERVAWAAALAALIEAEAAAAGRDDPRVQMLLEHAVARCDDADMPLHATIARRRWGRCAAVTRHRASRGRRCLAAERGVVAPERFAALLAPLSTPARWI